MKMKQKKKCKNLCEWNRVNNDTHVLGIQNMQLLGVDSWLILHPRSFKLLGFSVGSVPGLLYLNTNIRLKLHWNSFLIRSVIMCVCVFLGLKKNQKNIRYSQENLNVSAEFLRVSVKPIQCLGFAWLKRN